MAGKKKTLTKEEIEAKLGEFENKTNKSIENKKIGRNSQSSLLLESLKELIKKAIDNNVSYTQISKDIEEIYSFKVSAQTIRIFAKTKLGITRDNKKQTKTPAPTKAPIKEKNSTDRVNANIDEL